MARPIGSYMQQRPLSVNPLVHERWMVLQQLPQRTDISRLNRLHSRRPGTAATFCVRHVLTIIVFRGVQS